MRCVRLPGMVKDGVGWSAFAAVSGALMVRGGFTSSPSLFALDEAAPWVDSLGSQYLIHDLYFKPYCCCRWVQPAVRAALAVVERNTIDWRSIEEVRVETFAEACALSSKVPETSEEAQYGGPYPVAAALVHGDVGPQQVLEDYLGDERVLNLLSRIQVGFRGEFQREFPARRLVEVHIRAGGRIFASGVIAARGDPSEPLSDAEMQAKFRRYTAPHDHLFDLATGLDTLPDLMPIIDVLRDA